MRELKAWPEHQLWRVDVPWACFGLVVRAGRVVEVAPIASWAIGKTLVHVAHYFVRRGGVVAELRYAPDGQLFVREHRQRADGAISQFVRAL